MLALAPYKYSTIAKENPREILAGCAASTQPPMTWARTARLEPQPSRRKRQKTPPISSIGTTHSIPSVPLRVRVFNYEARTALVPPPPRTYIGQTESFLNSCYLA
ncbi:hypothetical protein M431DRAFT_519485, partial [Trichoderma harzianum CBS 226.95]